MKCNWWDQQPHGYSRLIICRSYFDLILVYSRPIICQTIPILFRVTASRSSAELFRSYFRLQQADLNLAKRVRDCRQNHHGCRQNKLRLLWNALLTTPYVSKHYKYMFLVARDLYEMLILYRGKHTSWCSMVGIWSEVWVYRAPIHKYTVGRRSAVGQVSRQPAIEVLTYLNKFSISLLFGVLDVFYFQFEAHQDNWKYQCEAGAGAMLMMKKAPEPELQSWKQRAAELETEPCSWKEEIHSQSNVIFMTPPQPWMLYILNLLLAVMRSSFVSSTLFGNACSVGHCNCGDSIAMAHR